MSVMDSMVCLLLAFINGARCGTMSRARRGVMSWVLKPSWIWNTLFLKLFLSLSLFLSLNSSLFLSNSTYAQSQKSDMGSSREMDDSLFEKAEPPESHAELHEVGASSGSAVEKIQVTGSRIRRINTEGPLPLVAVDREAIENSGYNSISDLIREMTLSSFGAMREQWLGSISGLAHANLRGLGAERTLVLLNGKRLAADAINRAVDLNLIPLAAIERVEILANGGSALYGSDALGGVINMITKKGYTGLEASLQQTLTQLEGGEKTHGSVTYGYASSSWSATGVFSYRNNRDIIGSEREWTDTKISTRGDPGTIGSLVNNVKSFQPSVDCPVERVDDSGNCTYNYSPHLTTRPQIEQLGGLVDATYNLAPEMEAYLRVLGTRKMTRLQYPASHGDIVLPGGQLSHITNSRGEPLRSFIDASGDIIFRQRFVELGPRRIDIQTNAYSALAGIKGMLFATESWEWDLSLGYHYVHRLDGRRGFILKDDLKKAILSSEFNPQAAEGQRGSLSQYEYKPYQKDTSAVAQAELNLTGELMELSHGPLGMSVGFVAGHENFETRTDQATKDGFVLNKGGLDGEGSRKTLSSYLELSLPLLQSLEWQLAMRYDNYNDFGSAFNPQVALRWSPSSSWMLRGSVGTGFMAPRIQDVYSSETSGYPSFIDHVLCRNQGKQCTPVGTPILRRGNKNLTEEKSIYGGLGTSYQITSQLHLAFDSWYMRIKDEIGSDFSAMTLAEAEFGSDYVRDYGIDIQRDPSTQEITRVVTPWLNLASKELTGIDLTARWNLAVPSWKLGNVGWLLGKLERLGGGRLDLKLAHSQIFYYKEELFPGLGFINQLGKRGKPAWREQISMTYSPHDKHQVYFGVRIVGPNDKFLGGTHKTYGEYDAQYKYLASWGGQWRLGVRNLLGSTPPLDETLPENQLNTSLYNNLGRYVSMGYNHKF